MRLARWAVAGLMLGTASGGTVRAQDGVMVTGWVRDGAGGAPVAQVSVTVEGTGLTARSGVDGAFRVGPVAAGEFLLRFFLHGFQSHRLGVVVPVQAGAQVSLGEVVLARAPAGAAELRGRIRDARTQAPLPWARLHLDGPLAAVADVDGRFRIEEVAWGAHRLEVRRIGYRPRALDVALGPEQKDVEVGIELEPVPVELPAVEVASRADADAGRLSEFYRRRARGWGHFLTREDIEKRTPVRVTDLLRTVPGVTVSSSGHVGLTAPHGFPGTCASPLILLDGIQVLGAGQAGTPDDRPPGFSAFINLDDLVPPHRVEAVEVYARPSQIPPELNQTGSVCGVIAIWTRQ